MTLLVLDFLTCTIYVKGFECFQHIFGIEMDTNCLPLFTDLFYL